MHPTSLILPPLLKEAHPLSFTFLWLPTKTIYVLQGDSDDCRQRENAILQKGGNPALLSTKVWKHSFKSTRPAHQWSTSLAVWSFDTEDIWDDIRQISHRSYSLFLVSRDCLIVFLKIPLFLETGKRYISITKKDAMISYYQVWRTC